MNRNYKVIWNASLNCFMAVSEYAKARGKSSKSSVSANATINTTSNLSSTNAFRLTAIGLGLGLLAAGFSIPASANNGTSNHHDGTYSHSHGSHGTHTHTNGNNSHNNPNGPGNSGSSISLNFEGDNPKTITRTNGQTLNILGGASGNLTTNNIGVFGSGDSLHIQLAENLTGLTSVTTGNSLLNTSGLAITGGPTFTKARVDVAGNKITGVASGVGNDSNAANIGDLNNAVAANKTKYYSVKNTSAAAATGPGSNVNNDGATKPNAMAMGVNASATGGQAIAIGSGDSGQNTTASGEQSIAIGANVESSGNSSIAIGGDDLDDASKVGGVNALFDTYTGGTGGLVTVGDYSGHTKSDGAASVAIGVKAHSKGNLSTAVGVRSSSSGDASSAFGMGSSASQKGSVALGAGSTTLTDATYQDKLTIGNKDYFYTGATNDKGAQVSVGSSGRERQIKHVASGEVSAASTDAINGSQLHATNESVKDLSTTVVANKTHYYSVNDGSVQQDNYNNDGATGNSSLAAGVKATATNNRAVAMGAEASATGSESTALGSAAQAFAGSATAVGFGARADQYGATAMGTNSRAQGMYSTAVGQTAKATGENSIAMGKGTEADGVNSIAIGTGNQVTGDNSGAFGDPNIVSGTGSYAVGNNNTIAANKAFVLGNNVTINAGDNHSIALGESAKINGEDSIAIGRDASAAAGTRNGLAIGLKSKSGNHAVSLGDRASSGNYAIALGSNSTASIGGTAIGQASSAVSDATALGRGAIAGQSGNVALGNSSITGAQHTGSFSINNLPVAGLTRGAKTVSVGAVGAERQIQNVAPGVVDATSTDAINGSQLHATNTQVNKGFGLKAADGQIVMKQLGEQVEVVGSNSNIDTRVNTVNGNVEIELNNNLDLGNNGSVTTGNLLSGTNVNRLGMVTGGLLTGGVTTVSGAGVTVTGLNPLNPSSVALTSNGLTILNGPSITKSGGVDAGSRQITNVASGGTTLTNAANIGDIQSTVAANKTKYYSVNSTGGTNDDNLGATGQNAMAMGRNAVASGSQAISIGSGASGQKTTASGEQSIAIGANVVSSGASSIAIGGDDLDVASQANIDGTSASGINGGNVNTTFFSYTGRDLVETPPYQVNTESGGAASIAMGAKALSQGALSTAIGVQSSSSGVASSAFGMGSSASAKGSVALGAGSVASEEASVALGSFSKTDTVVGTSGITLNGSTYVFAGTTPTSSVSIGGGLKDGVVVTRTITNVAAGRVEGTSTDAINGSQLHATNESINDLSTTVVANKTHYYSVKDGGTPKANYNNNGAIGNNAMAAGIGAEAKGDQATAVGYKAKAVASESTAIGREALAEGHRSVALGYAAKAKGPQSVAIGDNAETQARSAIAIGLGAKAFNGSSIAIGEGADTNTATDAIAFGTGANVKNRHGIALGIGATSVGDGALALGSGANANNLYTIAIGRNAQALHRESVAIGKGAIAKDGKAVSIGSENIASGDGAVAIGDPNVAIGAGAVAIGKDNTATGIGAIALGNESIATKDSNIALGDKAQASGNQSIAQGSHAMATGSQSIAQGTYAKATGNYSLAQGYFSEATRSGAIAYGRDAKAFGENAIAQGVKAKASGASSVAIGDGSEARGEDSIAMGRGAIAGQSDNVALGSNSITGAQHIGIFSINNLPVSGLINGAKTVSVGTVGAERQIQNVAPGVVDATSTDAINGSQLFVTNKAIGELGSTVGDGLNFVGDRDGVINRQFGDTLSIKGGAASTATLTNNNIGIRRDGSNGLIVELADKVNLGTNGSVNIGNTQVKNTGIIIAGSTLSNTVVLNNNGLNNGGFKVVNIDKGNVSATSADAINGSQLFGTAKSIANNFGGGSIVNPDGTVSTPVYQVNGNDQTGVAGAIAELDKGFNLETNSADLSTVKTGDTIDIGTATGETNIKVAKTGNDIKFKLADNIDLISVKTGNSFLNSNGLTITNGPRFTATGINAGNQQITGVSSGGVLTDANNDLNAANIGDVKGAIGNVTTLGFGIKAADGNTVMKPLGQSVEIVGSNSNIDTQVDNITGKVEVKLSNNLNLGPTGTITSGSIIGGGTIISPLGVTVTGPIGFNNASVTKDGLIISGGPQVIRTGINAGNKKIINVDKGVITATSTDAINGSQLFSTAQSIASNFGGDSVVNPDGTVSTPSYVLDDGTNTGTKALAFTNVGGALGNLDGRTTINSTNIAKGLSFNLNGNARNYQLGDIIRVDTDANIVTTANGNGAKFSLAPVINLGTTNPVQINGETGTISGLSNTTFDPDEIYEGGQAATQEQLSGLQSGISHTFDKGILFGGDNAPTTIKRKLGDTIIVKGGVSDPIKLTDSNIGVIADNNANTLTVKLATDLTGLNSASFDNDIMISSDGLKAGTTLINTSGVSFSGSAVGLNSSGLNNGGNKITNVASGDVSPTSTDAVNGSQLFNINKDIINKGIKIGDGDSANDQQFALGDTINVTGDSNITTTASATGVQVKLNNQLNLGDDGRMQMGNSIMNNTGFTFVGNEPGRTVILGAGGLNNGFNRITNVAAGIDFTDAATVGQLEATTFALDRGWALSTQGDEATMVKQGSAFDLNSRDGNIKISRTAAASSVGRASRAVDPNDMTFDLNRDIAIDSVQTGDTTINNQGLTIVGGPSVTKAGINAAGTKVTNVVNGEVAANSKDAINGGQLYAQGAGISSIIGGNTTYDPATGTFTNSNIGGTGQASIDGAIASIKRGEAVMTESIQTNTTNIATNTTNIATNTSNITKNTANIATNTANISTNTTNIKANKDKIDAGLNFGADSGAVINKPIGDGSVMSFKGGNNITTTAEGSSIKFDLNGNINVESVTTGNTTVNNNGVTIKNGPSMTAAGIYAGNAETAPSMTAAGINAAGTKVTNVADGMAPRDAVNYGQLEAVTRGLGGSINELGYKIGEVEDDANAGISAAMAMSSLPQAYLIGKPMIGGGIATYNGESAVAIGFSKMSNDGRWVMKLNGTADTQGNVGGAIGAGFHFD